MTLINRRASILLFLSAGLLVGGFAFKPAWFIGGLIGLFPAISWFIRDLREKQMGSDVLAILSIVGGLLIGEYFAASVISLMLHGGRALESWAEGQAESALKSLMDRMPKLAHRILNGQLETIDVAEVVAGDTLLVKSGEMVPVDGTAHSEC
jgi:cation transport ATPase